MSAIGLHCELPKSNFGFGVQSPWVQVRAAAPGLRQGQSGKDPCSLAHPKKLLGGSSSKSGLDPQSHCQSEESASELTWGRRQQQGASLELLKGSFSRLPWSSELSPLFFTLQPSYFHDSISIRITCFEPIFLVHSNNSSIQLLITTMKAAIFLAAAGVAVAQNLSGEPPCAVSLLPDLGAMLALDESASLPASNANST